MRRAQIVLIAGVLASFIATPARASDATVRQGFLRGIAQIRAAQAAEKLEGQLSHSLARLRLDHGSTVDGRKGRALAIRGFTWTLTGVRAQLDLVANDSGNIEAAVRHAKQADRLLSRGAALLRAAGRAFGVRVGRLNGH